MNRQEHNHRAAILALERAERKMVAAFTRWLTLRAKVKRYDARAEKGIGGTYDVRDLAKYLEGQ